jgi:hypothetical protein
LDIDATSGWHWSSSRCKATGEIRGLPQGTERLSGLS